MREEKEKREEKVEKRRGKKERDQNTERPGYLGDTSTYDRKIGINMYDGINTAKLGK